MEIISRRTNEGIVINDDIEITVLEVHQDHVRLGCFSPHHTPEYWEQDVYCSRQPQWTPNRAVTLSAGTDY